MAQGAHFSSAAASVPKLSRRSFQEGERKKRGKKKTNFENRFALDLKIILNRFFAFADPSMAADAAYDGAADEVDDLETDATLDRNRVRVLALRSRAPERSSLFCLNRACRSLAARKWPCPKRWTPSSARTI